MFLVSSFFAHSIETKYYVENEDVVGAAPKLHLSDQQNTNVRLILYVLMYIFVANTSQLMA